MHIKRDDLQVGHGSEGETVLEYPTDQQPDVQSLERFKIRWACLPIMIPSTPGTFCTGNHCGAYADAAH
jgi:hypothetical protein